MFVPTDEAFAKLPAGTLESLLKPENKDRLAAVLGCMFGWWRDVVREAQGGQDHTAPVAHGLRMGMVLFIVSEVMFFFAFFWAYFHSSVPFLSKVAHTTWPPEGVIPLETWDLPFLNTLIQFVIVAFVVFLLVKLINRLRREQAAQPNPAPAAPTPTEALLAEIRDELKARPGA